ncbi:MAG: hypothetical protein H6887_08760 [Hoeflea sp.]|nr:hypothetical protein [Hoeflea sp.]
MAKSETADHVGPMFGNKLYQQRAKKALPLLIQYAKARRIVTYSELAEKLDMPNPRNLNYVLGCVGRTLAGLATQNAQSIPKIQALVVAQSSGQPGKGIDGFFAKPSLQDRRAIIETEQHAAFDFHHWDEVLERLGVSPSPHRFGDLIQGAIEFGGGGEGEDHRRLKEWIRDHPEIFNLRMPDLTETERKLASGDSLDVSFQTSNLWFAAEVKAVNSGEPDLTRGIFQIVKYKAIMKAECKVAGSRMTVDAKLVIESNLPPKLKTLARFLAVEVIEVERHHKGYNLI